MRLCAEWLQCLNIPIFITREPGGTELGIHIRKLLLEDTEISPITNTTELLLYAADRAQHVEQEIRPNLEAGKIILCDRFTDSTVAYQGYGRNLNMNLIDKLNAIATGGIQPDLTLWLDLDVKVGFTRKSKNNDVADRIEKEKIDFHYRVQEGFNYLAVTYPQRIIKLDASLTPNEVHQQIQAILKSNNIFI